jgi:hypothetical protein
MATRLLKATKEAQTYKARSEELRESLHDSDVTLHRLTTYVDNNPDKDSVTLQHFPLKRYVVVHKKTKEIVANLMATRPINTPHLFCVEVGLNDAYTVGEKYEELPI